MIIEKMSLGEVYYTRRVAFTAIGIIVAVILPLMMCIVCGAYRFRQKQLKENPQWQMSLPRSRASSRTNLRQLSNSVGGGIGGPEDDSDTDTTGILKKSRSYDKVYRTNEPLPGKPLIDFPAKKWDLDDEDFTSSEGILMTHYHVEEYLIDFVFPHRRQIQAKCKK